MEATHGDVPLTTREDRRPTVQHHSDLQPVHESLGWLLVIPITMVGMLLAVIYTSMIAR